MLSLSPPAPSTLAPMPCTSLASRVRMLPKLWASILSCLVSTSTFIKLHSPDSNSNSIGSQSHTVTVRGKVMSARQGAVAKSYRASCPKLQHSGGRRYDSHTTPHLDHSPISKQALKSPFGTSISSSKSPRLSPSSTDYGQLSLSTCGQECKGRSCGMLMLALSSA